MTRRRTPAQDVDHLGDQAGAAAIDQRVLEIERLQAAERRAFPDLLLRRRLFDALEPVANPFAQMDFDQLLELRRLLEIVEGRPEGAVRIAEPPVDELAHRIELGDLLGALLAVLHRQPHFGGLQVAEDLRRLALLEAMQRALELVFGAGAVSAAVGPAELLERQRRADPRPQDEQREIGLLDVEDLRLEGVGGAQQAALPQVGLELDLAAEFKLQPLGDGERDGTLGTDVSRRGHEHTQPKQWPTPASPRSCDLTVAARACKMARNAKANP